MNNKSTNKYYLKEISNHFNLIFCNALDKIEVLEKEIIALNELLKQKKDCSNSLIKQQDSFNNIIKER